MAKCKNCNIEILDETVSCPLCQSILEQTEDVENMYPDVRLIMRKFTLTARIFLFVSIVLEGLLFTYNLVTFDSYPICDHRTDPSLRIPGPPLCGDRKKRIQK